MDYVKYSSTGFRVVPGVRARFTTDNNNENNDSHLFRLLSRREVLDREERPLRSEPRSVE